MKISSSWIINGIIEKRFGKFSETKLENVPTISLPVSWSDLPIGTKSVAVIMQDYDAVPVCGFSWIHWLLADMDPALGGLPENASRENISLIQGKNSLASKQVYGELPDSITCHYGGPRPPDRDHEYEIRVFALDTMLGFEKWFRYNEIVRAMRGHTLSEEAIYGWYPTSE